MASVTLEGVRKVYEDRGRLHVAVDTLDLAVADGEFLVLVGPSGCGKSTTLRMVAGLETPTAGTLRIGDRVVNDVASRDRDVAMVFQNYALYPHMTVYENLAFALKLRQLPRVELDARVTKAAILLGLDQLLERRPRQLSGGQRQRVALGRAIVRQPRVFLFDEPLSNLDAKLRVHMRRELAALRRRLGTTTLYVTHDQLEAMTLGDRIVLMHEGRVQQVDTPLALYQQPANTFVATFIGNPPMNLIRGTIAGGDEAKFVGANGAFVLPVSGAPAALLPAPGTPVTLGVRPEALRLVPATGTPLARVEEVELLGNETIVSLTAGEVSLTARIDGPTTLQRGDEVGIAATVDALHWFDGQEKRLPPGLARS